MRTENKLYEPTLSEKIETALTEIDKMPTPPRYYSGKLRDELFKLKNELKNKINETHEELFNLNKTRLTTDECNGLITLQNYHMTQINKRLEKLPIGYCELVTKTAKAAGIAAGAVLLGVAGYAIKSGAIELAVPAALNFFSGNSTATNP
jgi:hypothetical protein